MREEAVRSESIARKQVDTANARHGSERGSEHRSRGSREIRRTRGMDQREDRSHGESAIRADCEEACARGGEDRWKRRAHITSENGRGSAEAG